eukprot:891877-Pleurochrysis_carterae.AAC.1
MISSRLPLWPCRSARTHPRTHAPTHAHTHASARTQVHARTHARTHARRSGGDPNGSIVERVSRGMLRIA